MAKNTNDIAPAICVIGAGPGGIAVATAAASVGVPTVLIEKGRIGGESFGSTPARALTAAAEQAKAWRVAARFGLKTSRSGIDLAAIKGYAGEVTSALAPNFARQRFTGLGIRLIEGTARFADPRTVKVDGATIAARRFVIATGSLPVVPDIPGLSATPHLTETTVFDLAEVPRHLIVIGAGAIGLELAQVFRRLGADVTVLEAARPLVSDDPEGVAVVLDALLREGIVVRAGVTIARVGRAFARVQVTVAGDAGEETIEGSHLLVAAGRRINVGELGLEAAGIRTAAHGLKLDRTLRTSNKRVYAVGDAAGGPNYSHVAHYHASLVIRHALFSVPVRVERQILPWVTYTDPELAQVGMLEDEARAHAGIIRVLRWPYRENDRAQVEGTTRGHIKVITDRSGDILGATIVGRNAGESITPWTLAISQKLNIQAIASLVVPYPSYAEVGKRAAITYFTQGLKAPRKRRVMRWLPRFR